jgi:hypothetical protein
MRSLGWRNGSVARVLVVGQRRAFDLEHAAVAFAALFIPTA